MSGNPDLTLSDGRAVTFDLTRITMREFRSLFDGAQANEVGDELVGRTCGMSGDDLGALPYVDYRRLMAAFFKRCREPLADPS